MFIEDIGEHPYRIERMLLQLQYAGILNRQQVIVRGDFFEYRLAPHDNGYDFDAMLAFLRTHVSMPILTGLPFGHIRDRVTLPVGVQAELRSELNGFQPSFQNSFALTA